MRPAVDTYAGSRRHRTLRRQRPAVDCRRREPRDLRLQARHRIVIEDDPIAGVEEYLAAESPPAPDRRDLEVVRYVHVPVDFDFSRLQQLSKHLELPVTRPPGPWAARWCAET